MIMNRRAVTRIQAIALIVIVVVAAAAGSAFYWLSTRPAGPVVNEVLGVILMPMSGSFAYMGTESVQGAQLAVDDINNAGGIKSLGGAKLKVLYQDCTSDATTAVSEMERAILNNNPIWVGGVYSSAMTYVVMDTTEKYKVPFITSSVADKITERGYRYIFRLTPRASFYGNASVDYVLDMAQKKGVSVTTYAVVYEDSSWGLTNANAVKAHANDRGLTMVAEEKAASGLSDFSPIVNRLKSANPDVVFMAHYTPDSTVFARTTAELDFAPKAFVGLAGAGYAVYDFITGSGKNGAFFSTSSTLAPPIPALGTSVVAVGNAYKARFGHDMTEAAGEWYVIMWAIKEAFELSASTSREDFIDKGLLKLDVTTGPASWMGGVKFDAKHDNAYAGVMIYQVLNGAFKVVWPSKYAEETAVFPFPPWSTPR